MTPDCLPRLDRSGREVRPFRVMLAIGRQSIFGPPGATRNSLRAFVLCVQEGRLVWRSRGWCDVEGPTPSHTPDGEFRHAYEAWARLAHLHEAAFWLSFTSPLDDGTCVCGLGALADGKPATWDDLRRAFDRDFEWNPGDDVSRLAFADWLQDRYDVTVRPQE